MYTFCTFVKILTVLGGPLMSVIIWIHTIAIKHYVIRAEIWYFKLNICSTSSICITINFIHTHSLLCRTCNTHVLFWVYYIIEHAYYTCIIYTCINYTCSSTYVIHMYAIHLYYMVRNIINMCITGVLNIYYKCMKYMCKTPTITTHVSHVHHTCNTHVAHFLN